MRSDHLTKHARRHANTPANQLLGAGAAGPIIQVGQTRPLNSPLGLNSTGSTPCGTPTAAKPAASLWPQTLGGAENSMAGEFSEQTGFRFTVKPQLKDTSEGIVQSLFVPRP